MNSTAMKTKIREYLALFDLQQLFFISENHVIDSNLLPGVILKSHLSHTE